MEPVVLRIEGEVERACEFRFAELMALPEQIPDIGDLVPGREGGAVRLQTLLEAAGVTPQATHITLHATDGDFSASVPLAPVIEQAVVLYRAGDIPLPVSQGGPLRFLIPDVDACGIDVVDACANVKFLGRIELTHGPGADTRPTTS